MSILQIVACRKSLIANGLRAGNRGGLSGFEARKGTKRLQTTNRDYWITASKAPVSMVVPCFIWTKIRYRPEDGNP